MRLAFLKSAKTILCFDSGYKIVLLQNIKTFLFGFAGGGKVSLKKVGDSSMIGERPTAGPALLQYDRSVGG